MAVKVAEQNLLIEARLFEADYASLGDILRLKSLGVQWDGKTRMQEIPIEKESAPAIPWPGI